MNSLAHPPLHRPARAPRRKNRLGLALSIGLHATLLLAVLSYAPARESLRAMAPIMVSLITPPALDPPRPSEAPKPLPLRPRETPRAMPLIAAPVETTSTYIAPQQPEPPNAVLPISAPPPPVAQGPAPVIPPRFDAAYLDNPAPSYPALARRMGEQGKVILRVLVSAAGTAEKVELRTSSGSARLDTTALETVRQWRFVPARQGPEAVPAWVLVPISFALQG